MSEAIVKLLHPEVDRKCHQILSSLVKHFTAEREKKNIKNLKLFNFGNEKYRFGCLSTTVMI